MVRTFDRLIARFSRRGRVFVLGKQNGDIVKARLRQGFAFSLGVLGAVLTMGSANAQAWPRPIDWQGHYRGVLACAKPCAGIEADLELYQRQGKTRFRLLEIVYGPKLSTHAGSGVAVWLKDGRRLSFSMRRGKRIVNIQRGFVVYAKAGRHRPGVKERGRLRKISDIATSSQTAVH